MIDIDFQIQLVLHKLKNKENQRKILLEKLDSVSKKVIFLATFQKPKQMAEIEKPELTGILFKILNLLETKSGFRKQEFIIKTDEAHPQYIKLEFHNDKCDLINQYEIGDNLKIFFNIRGKQWISPVGKEVYFTSFVAWRINKLENGYVVPTEEQNKQMIMNLPDPKDVFGDSVDFRGNKYEDDDDLPF